MRKMLFSLLAICAMTATASPVIANPIVSVAAPNTFGTAQNVNSAFSLTNNPNVFNSTTQPHVEVLQNGASASGFFFYSFTTASAGTMILDIDSASTNTNFDTMIHLFNSAGTLLATSDDNGGDVGDGPNLIGGTFNSRINTGVLPAGNYVIGVGRFFSSGGAGGVISGAPVPQGGTFTLNISANAAIPEPATLAVFGLGVLAMGGYGLRRVRKTATV